MPLAPGQVLQNRYRIVRLLGQGGFGAVYRAWDMNMHAVCAVKENLDTSSAAQSQFKNEATLLFGLRHPNLPVVHDQFLISGQGQYLVMDFIEGEDLECIVRRSGALPVGQALVWIGEVCDALTYLHTCQPPVIHRDVKPANLKITPDGRVVLVDFGIAKQFDPALGTKTGARAYTPGYSSPEQHSGALTDAQSDVYSLGATAYTLLTGLTPPDTNDIFAGLEPPPSTVHQANPQVPLQVSQAVERAMQFKRPIRMKTVAEFKTVIEKVTSPKRETDTEKVFRKKLLAYNRLSLILITNLVLFLWINFSGVVVGILETIYVYQLNQDLQTININPLEMDTIQQLIDILQILFLLPAIFLFLFWITKTREFILDKRWRDSQRSAIRAISGLFILALPLRWASYWYSSNPEDLSQLLLVSLAATSSDILLATSNLIAIVAVWKFRYRKRSNQSLYI